MEEDFVWKILLQLVLAILEVRTYWHQYWDCRLYRNLRAENLLLDSDNNVKLQHSGLNDFFRDSSSNRAKYDLESVCYAPPVCVSYFASTIDLMQIWRLLIGIN